MDYKKYSLENLENWMHDAMSAGEATPQEIYDVILNVVKDNYYTYKQKTSEAYELLALLNGNGQSYEDVMKERNYYEGCDRDDQSEECKKSWTSFWEDPPWGHSDLEALRYTEEELNAMCDKAASDQEKEKCREYNLREAEYYDKRAQLDAKVDRVVKWQLPVQVDGLTGDCFVNFPDDLLEAANLKEGDMIEWVDQGNGSYLLRKVNEHS